MRPHSSLLSFTLIVCLPACGDDGSASNNDSETDTDTPGSTGIDGSTSSGPTDPDTTASSGTGDDTDSPPPDLEGARMIFEPIVRAQCEQAFSCCNADELFLRLGGTTADAATCTTRILDLMEAGISPPNFGFNDVYLQNFLPLFAYGLNGEVTANEAGIEACAASISEQGCPASIDGENCSPSAVVPSSACELRNLFVGNGQLGDACGLYQNIECAQGLQCNIYGPNTGVCIETLSAGDPCFDDYNCQGDLLCDYMTDTCIEPALVGEPCAYADHDAPQLGTESIRCAPGLNCNPASGVCESQECTFGTYCNEDDTLCPEGLSCVTGQCDFLAEAGEQCWNDDDCAEGQCTYNGQSHVCQPLAGNGASCFDAQQCESGFCNNTGSCAAQIDVGDACDGSQSQYECDGGYCDGAMCVAFVGVGEDCTAGPCDYTQDVRCIADECVAPPFPNGEFCNDDDECDSGHCSGVCNTPLALGDACAVGSNECASDAYCAAVNDGGECRARLPEGAPCTTNADCWGQCEPVNGELRCFGTAPGQRVCDGA